MLAQEITVAWAVTMVPDPFDITVFLKVVRQEFVKLDSVTF